MFVIHNACSRNIQIWMFRSLSMIFSLNGNADVTISDIVDVVANISHDMDKNSSPAPVGSITQWVEWRPGDPPRPVQSRTRSTFTVDFGNAKYHVRNFRFMFFWGKFCYRIETLQILVWKALCWLIPKIFPALYRLSDALESWSCEFNPIRGRN